MATFTERTDSTGATSYRVEVRLKGYPAQHATFTRKTDAQKWAQATESAIREGRHFGTIEAKRHTLTDLIDRHTRDVLLTKKAKTQARLWPFLQSDDGSARDATAVPTRALSRGLWRSRVATRRHPPVAVARGDTQGKAG